MSKKTDTYYVAIDGASGATAADIKAASEIIFREIARIRDNEDHMRGFLYAANQDGYPVKAGFATKAQLEELCVRAFWWKFERIIEERKALLRS